MTRRLAGLLFLGLLAVPCLAQAATWKIDSAHSSVGFQIRHLFSKVRGGFDEFSGSIEYDPAAPTASKVEATITTASIDTKNQKRDDHLRSADFFDAATNPNIIFKSTKVDTSGTGLLVTGDFTMHGVTKPVVLEVAILGVGPHPFIAGGQVAGFTAKTRINRQDWGMKWNKPLDSGGMLLDDELDIELEVEAVNAPPK
jgi:polyisoprenoid-binding protein YceI